MTKTLGFGVLIILVAAAAYFLLAPQPVANTAPDASEGTSQEPVSNTSMMRVEENMVVVMEQKPGTTVIGTVVLKEPGYLVIHADQNGTPGAILGSSALLQAGENTNVKVTLTRASKDGEKLHAMLHNEKNGNATFNASEDTAVQSSLGGPISGWFDISENASADIPISI
jgi:hypothetical protein